MNAALRVDARATLGECPLWCERSASLWWTDIQSCTLSRWRPADGSLRHWTLPDRVGSFAFCAGDDRLLLGLATGIALFHPETQALSPIVPLDAPPAEGLRINDGRCDREGRFVFGMFNTAEAPVGHFYRVHGDLRIERLPLPPAGVANSIAFSPDGRTMYYADSPTRTIFRADYAADGRVGAPRVFVTLAASEGYPDGSTVDANGGLWNAQWEGGCVVRYDSEGRETARIALPATRPTCPAFGGTTLDTLYVTSARIGLRPEALAQQPAAGGVLEMQPGWHGLPESRFVLAGTRP
ncbi:SMP-30/gluconolactonase/LRE family protein [Ramlibacter pallidus]|uniref:SMP-30/gluconolactonase/LRE family protein n=1 Tax=Ramlibacter pallidus TaxID=2780087 RepID=UPI001D0D6793|nr:SMP-30/gluconolactonase/LRE family protein [Ramlibacter pallidus]